MARARGPPFSVCDLYSPAIDRTDDALSVCHTNVLSTSVGGTNKELDLQNPDNLGQESTDNGVVPNLKWSFSDSKTRLLPGGWVREQVITDLPASHDISGAQQHLSKGAFRELHWHRVVSIVFHTMKAIG